MPIYISAATGNWDAAATWANAWVADTVQTVGSWRRPTVANGHIYECTASAGDFKTHATTEPTWPTTNGDTVVDDQVTWTCRADYPQTAGDGVTISASQTITYNVVSTTELGAISVNGLFTVATGQSTKLSLGNVTITITSTGEMRWGNTSTPVGAAYTAEVLWNTTGDGNGIQVDSGGLFTAVGDPAVYGSTQEAVLAASHTNGQTFTIVGNYSAIWGSGQTLLLHKYGPYESPSTDLALVTLNGAPSNAANSVCTINETFSGTFAAGGRVVAVDRNVRLGKLGASTTVGDENANRPRIYTFTAPGEGPRVVVQDAVLTGFYRAYVSAVGGSQATFTRAVVRNGNTAFRDLIDVTMTGGILYSLAWGYFSDGNEASGFTMSPEARICGCSSEGVRAGFVTQIDGEIYACPTGLRVNWAMASVAGAIYGCQTGLLIYSHVRLSAAAVHSCVTGLWVDTPVVIVDGGGVGYTAAGVSKPNTTDVRLDAASSSVLMRATYAPTPLVVNATSALSNGDKYWPYPGGVFSEDHHRVSGASWSRHGTGSVERSTTVTRGGGASSSLRVVPASTCDVGDPLLIAEWTEAALPPATYNRSIYIKGGEAGETWGGGNYPTTAQLYVEASYLSGTGPLVRETVVSTAVLTDDATWTAFSLPAMVQAATGHIHYRIWLKKYRANTAIYVDNKLS